MDCPIKFEEKVDPLRGDGSSNRVIWIVTNLLCLCGCDGL